MSNTTGSAIRMLFDLPQYYCLRNRSQGQGENKPESPHRHPLKKVAHVLCQLGRGEARVMFDPNSETVDIVVV